jgi:hypothetical protein
MKLPRKTLFALAFVGTALVHATLAHPQQPSAYPPPCDVSKVTRADGDRAHNVFLSGKQFLEESNYDKAISYFKDAYTIDCSVHGILPIIATAYERKGDKREAVRALEEYLNRAPTAADHEVIERRIRNLKDQIGQEPPPLAATPTGAAPSAPTTPSATAPAASAAPEAATPSASSSGGNATQALTPGEGHSAAPWVVAGLGAAALAGGLIVVGVGVSDVSNAENVCMDHAHCGSSSAADQGNLGRTLQPIGFAAAGIGVAAIAAGLVWHFTERAPRPATGLLIHPALAPGFAGASIGSTF